MKLQTIQHADGSLEIQRRLSLDWLEDCQDGDPLLYESSIVWLEDIATLPYVREMTVPQCKSRRGPLRQGSGGRIVGYSTLQADAPADRSSGMFTRRVFYLKDSDSHASRIAGHRLPANAVDPRSVLPGAASQSPSEAPVTSQSLLKSPACGTVGPRTTPPPRRRGDSVVLEWLAVAEDQTLGERSDVNRSRFV